MWLSVDSKIAGRKRKLKELSHENPIKRADTVHRVESNTDIFAKREYTGLFGVIDHGMLYIVMMYQLGRPCAFFTQRK
jgi:hypothetical protein